MEGKRNATRVRMRAWTPASGYSSPPSPVSSQLSWGESRDEDFQSQMDENGIIGLTEAQGKGFNITRTFPHSRPGRDLFSGITNNEIEEITKCRDESYPLQRNIDPEDNWMDSHNVTSHEGKDNKNKTDAAVLETRTPSRNSCDERSHVSSSPSFKSTSQTPFYPSLPEPSLQEEAGNYRTDVKAFAESDRRQLRNSPRSYQSEEEPASALSLFVSETASPELEQKSAGPRHNHCTSEVDYPLSITAQSTAKDSTYMYGHRRHYSTSKTSLTDPNDVRKGQLSHPLPDFSKVEPRVRFPKSDYKPPKSRKPPHKERSKPEAPVVFKSPADIVREALSSNSEGPSNPAAPTDSQKPTNTKMPEEFRCPQEAGAMVQQLQEDYNRLLTKYAEAENTIDRLRLEAKVSLYSDPPKPSQPGAFSGVLKEGSKILALSFPQAQRAELSTDAIQPIQQRLSSDALPSSWHHSPAAASLTEGLSKQMAGFQLQVNEFEKLLKNRRLKPYEQTQNPTSAAHTSVMVGLEVSSVSGESDAGGESGEDDMLPSVCRPLNHKQHRVEKGFSRLMDHYQSFRDLSKLLDRDQDVVDQNSLGLCDRSSHPARIDGVEIEQQWKHTDKGDSNKPLQP
ncbi:AT-hook-containing transcription factor-like isoform X1, partial [Clarias magur]